MTNIPCPFHPFLSWFWKHCVDVLTSWNLEKCFTHNSDFLHRHDVFDESLIVHRAIFILLALHESIDLSFIHFLTQC